jgi:orotidine-5'-phosphate decarboxylase
VEVTQPPIPIVALDVENTDEAMRVVDALDGLCTFYKVGSELYTGRKGGPAVLDALHARGASAFLDLKFHDIPNTVRGAVRAAMHPGVRLLTVHAAGGRAMVEAAVGAAAGHPVGILAVTVLTSLDAAALGDVWGRPVDAVEPEVVRLAALALGSGAHGVVCSGREAAALRSRFGQRMATLVPGVRLAGDGHQDQSRVVTPAQAARAGATYIVLGRTVTAASSPRDAMKAVLADLS